ncbi:MAG: serine hydrolase domain-containing protein [Sphingomonadales bacterium]
MRRIFRTLPGLSLLLIFVAGGPAAADGELRSARFLAAIDALTPIYAESADLAEVPGISVAVAKDRRLVWTAGFGFENIEAGIPMTPRSRLRIGSIAKVMTAAAMARLYEQGKINLDAPIRSLVPAWPEKRWPLTLRQLSGHTAGVRHYRDGAEFLMNRPFASVTEGLSVFKDDPLLFKPGSRVSYSTFGWSLISAGLEAAADQDFLHLMRLEVFGPLGMEDTSADLKGVAIPHRSGFYELDADGKLHPAPEVDNSYKWAGGGFLATTADVARFAAAHARPGYLKRETLDLLFQRQKLTDGTITPYGLGWMVSFATYIETIERRLPKAAQDVGRAIMEKYPFTVLHSGGSVGGTSIMLLSRRDGLTVVVSMNSSQGKGLPLLLALHTFDAFIRLSRSGP